MHTWYTRTQCHTLFLLTHTPRQRDKRTETERESVAVLKKSHVCQFYLFIKKATTQVFNVRMQTSNGMRCLFSRNKIDAPLRPIGNGVFFGHVV